MPDSAGFIPALIGKTIQYLSRSKIEKALADAKASMPAKEYQALEKAYQDYLKVLEQIKSGNPEPKP